MWSGDTLENLYFAVMLLLAIFLAWNGWKKGAAQQLLILFALIGAYAAAWFGREMMAPFFSFLGYPDWFTRVIGGGVLGIVVFAAVRIGGSFLLRHREKTAQEKTRANYAFIGALFGLLFAGLIFVLMSDVIRLSGALTSPGIQEGEALQKREKHEDDIAVQEPSLLIQGIARLASALNEGNSGAVLERVDPVPQQTYSNILKLGMMTVRPEAVQRFQKYPGVNAIARHSELQALIADPEIAKLVQSRSFHRLLKNKKVVALANDKEFSKLILQLDLNAALDYALENKPSPEQPPKK